MEFIGLLTVAAGLVWLVALWKQGDRLPGWLLPAGLVAMVFVEPVLGAEFFRIEKGPLPLSLDRLLLATLTFLAARTWWGQRTARQCWTRLDSAVAIWLGVLVFSTIMGDFRFRENLPLRRLVFFNLMPVMLYLLARQVDWTPARLRWLLWSWTMLAVYLAGTGLLEWRGLHGWVFPRHIVDPSQAEFFGRARGPLMNPVINGMLINAGIAVLFLGMFRGGKQVRICGVLLLPLLLAGAYATLTRSVWVGAAFSVATVVLAHVSWRMRAGLTVAGLVGVLTVVSGFGGELNRFKRDRDVTPDEMAQSISLRPLLAIVALEMFRDYPLGGVGFGNYSQYKTDYHYLDQYDAPLTMALPYMQHNVLGSYATESGLIGLAGLLFLLGCGGTLAWRLWSNQNGFPESRGIGLLALCGLGNYLINGMFHDVSIVPACHSQLLFSLGLVSTLTARLAAESAATNGEFTDQPVAAGLEPTSPLAWSPPS